MFLIFIFIIIFSFFPSLFLLFRSNRPTREFKVNNYLSLKLEDGRTNIYVKNRLFRQCMYLLLNIQTNCVRDYDTIKSIDEAAETLDRSMESDPLVRSSINPEEEFMGHCSNIQVWTENGYDTRILHRNLAFPLLKRLTEVGDPQAKKVFKEEIAIRLSSGYPTVVQFLIQNGYLKFLSIDEFESILEDINLPILDELIDNLHWALENFHNNNSRRNLNYFINNLVRNFGVQNLPLIFSQIIKEIPENFRENVVIAIYEKFKKNRKFPLFQFLNSNLQYFKDYGLDYIRYYKTLVGFFKDNKLYLRNKNIEDITKLEGLKDKTQKVEELDLSDNLITELKGISSYSNLKVFKCNNNQIKEIRGLENLKNLKRLYLRNNNISEIRGLEKLCNLEDIDLSGNAHIEIIPDILLHLSSLKTLKLWNCNIKKFTSSTSKFFWMEQNYRYFKGYTPKDREYYESSHNRKACSDNKLYKHFVEWVLKIRNLMTEYKFNYNDIKKFESKAMKKAIWSGRVTNAFSKWIYNKKQMRITDFL